MPARILVVDDDPAVREYASTTLESAGFAVTDVASGEQALDAMREQPFDVIVLDKAMPGMDGDEVARRLRDEPGGGQLAIVMLSGLDSDQDQWDGWRAGVDIYVTKPFDDDELIAHIRRLLRLRAMAR
ncbi:MAG TPA: response regulator transcription factor [Actinomycetota bacterium]|nr:response regulator transcription factor [Actinomycetota bacterium]